MKISIITPSYNAGKYIERAIQSVLQQDYRNWEHIIVDGGSTDDTLEILNRYQHLRSISEPDKGIYDAMNKGINLARGEWIFFLGSDDQLIKNDVLSGVAKYLDDHQDVIYGNVIFKSSGLRYRGEMDEHSLLKFNLCQQSIFYKRDKIFKKEALYFSLRYPILSDWEHNFRWFLNNRISKRFINLDICLYNDGGSSATGFEKDKQFRKDRRLLFLTYLNTYMPLKKSMELFKWELKQRLIERDIRNVCLLLTRLPKLISLGLMNPDIS